MDDEKKLNIEHLIEFMIINVEHARHVENERLNFTYIYVAAIIGFFSFIFNADASLNTIFSLLFLIALGFIGFLLTKRWSDVFDGHMNKAKEIALLIYGDKNISDNAKDASLLIYGIDDQNKYEPLYNRYYYFKHNYRHRVVLRRLKQLSQTNPHATYEEAACSINFNSKWHLSFQIRTKDLFYLFYFTVICTLSALLIYSILKLHG